MSASPLAFHIIMAGIYRSGMAVRIGRTAKIICQNKPFSFLSPSTRAVGNKQFAIDLLNMKNLRGKAWDSSWGQPRDWPGLQCAGRLDADSTGLLVWTDDAALQQFIIDQRTDVEKEYLVRIRNHEHWTERQMDDSLELFRGGGVDLDGKPLLPATVRRINENQLQVVLTEGRHRQIRRMCALVGLEVIDLKRVRIGNLRLASLPTGCWSSLTPAMAASLLLPRHPRANTNLARKPKPPPLHWRSDATSATPDGDAEQDADRRGDAIPIGPRRRRRAAPRDKARTLEASDRPGRMRRRSVSER